MRQAAGILMVAFGLFLFIVMVSEVRQYGVSAYDLAFYALLIIPAAFIFTGGVLCLKREYWKVCFASAVVTVVIMILWLIGHGVDSILLAWIVSMVGTFPIIFVLLTKKEWQEIQG